MLFPKRWRVETKGWLSNVPPRPPTHIWEIVLFKKTKNRFVYNDEYEIFYLGAMNERIPHDRINGLRDKTQSYLYSHEVTVSRVRLLTVATGVWSDYAYTGPRVQPIEETVFAPLSSPNMD